jgi:hypothetical protein
MASSALAILRSTVVTSEPSRLASPPGSAERDGDGSRKDMAERKDEIGHGAGRHVEEARNGRKTTDAGSRENLDHGRTPRSADPRAFSSEVDPAHVKKMRPLGNESRFRGDGSGSRGIFE